MYKIQVKSKEDYASASTFQTSVTIKPNDKDVERHLTNLFDRENYYLSVYQNPIFWFINSSPIFVYIGKYESDFDVSSRLLKIEQKMKYSFKKIIHRKYFESSVEKVLKNFLEKQLMHFKRCRNSSLLENV